MSCSKYLPKWSKKDKETFPQKAKAEDHKWMSDAFVNENPEASNWFITSSLFKFPNQFCLWVECIRLQGTVSLIGEPHFFLIAAHPA